MSSWRPFDPRRPSSSPAKYLSTRPCAISPALAVPTGGDTWTFLSRKYCQGYAAPQGGSFITSIYLRFPMARVLPGSHHALRIQIRGRPELKTRTRTRTGSYEVARRVTPVLGETHCVFRAECPNLGTMRP